MREFDDENVSAVTPEMAEAEFETILSAARVEWPMYVRLHGKDVEVDKEIIINAIMHGAITVDEFGFPTVHTESENTELKSIKIKRRPFRGDMLAADRVKKDHDVAKEDAVFGKFLGIAPGLLTLLEERDYKLIHNLWTIFLGY